MAGAENANNLGAPAHGFGQDVSFAAPVGQVPTQRDIAQAVPAQAGVIGSSGQNAADHTIVARPVEDPTWKVLMNVGKDILEPMMKEKRTEAFVRGMSKVAQGEAVKDIVDQQPWYAAIFGGSDASAGARAYAGHQQAALASGALEDKMPELRKVPPDQAQKAFSGIINSNLTGDATTDTQIIQSLTSQMPALMRRHAKEHFAWQQDQASQAEAKSMVAGAQLLQKSAQGMVFESEDGQVLPGVVRPEELKAQANQWVQSIAPVAGRDAANWQINTSKTLVSMARQGLFHALGAFESQGGFNALTEDQASKVRQAWEVEEKQARSAGITQYTNQLAMIHDGVKNLPQGRSPAVYGGMVDDINNAFQARTGSRVPLISGEQKVELLSQGLETLRREQKAMLSEATKQQAAARDVAAKDELRANTVRQSMTSMANGVDPGLAGVSADDKSEAWRQLRMDPVKWITAATQMQRNAQQVDKGAADIIQGQLKGAAGDPDGPGKVEGIWQNRWTPLATGLDAKGQPNRAPIQEDVAAAYFGDQTKSMRMYDRMRLNGVDSGTAYNQAFVLPKRIVAVGTSEKADIQLRSDVKSQLQFAMPEFLGGNIDIRPDQVGMVSGLIKYDKHGEMLDSDDHKVATQVAIGRLQRNEGLEVSGGFAWLNGNGRKSIGDLLDTRVPKEKLGENMRDTINAKLKAQGLSGDHITMSRYEDGPGEEPRMTGYVTDKDGTVGVITFTGSEIAGTYAVRKAKHDIAKTPEFQKQNLLSRDLQQSREQAAAARNSGRAY